jgi:hypothetical protein
MTIIHPFNFLEQESEFFLVLCIVMKVRKLESCVSFVSEFLCESVKGLRVRFCQELTVITMLQVLKC